MNDRNDRQKKCAVKQEVAAMKLNLANLEARAGAEAQARAAAVAQDLDKAREQISCTKECMELMRKPNEEKGLYHYVQMRIVDTYTELAAEHMLCMLLFWKLLYELDRAKRVISLSRGERDIYSVFKCSMISVNDGPVEGHLGVPVG
jgi:hypothetical protein